MMELAEIKELIADFEGGSIRELKIDDGDFHLALSKNENQPVTMPTAPTAMVPTTSAPVMAPVAEAIAPAVDTANIDYVKAPLVGSVYLQASEGGAPFVEVGQHVEKGQTVAIIEAMKMMTEIKAAISGKVTEILVSNEEIVEFDKPLFKVIRD